MSEAALVREWRAPFCVDVRSTLSAHGRGGGDPTFRVDEAGAVWRTSLTPDGPGTIRVRAAAPVSADSGAPAGADSAAPVSADSAVLVSADFAARVGADAASGEGQPRTRSAAGTRVLAHAWGPGAAWLLDALPEILGLHDDVSGFDPDPHPVLREIVGTQPGLRVGRSGRLMEALIPAILEQKVPGAEARRAWGILLTRFGARAPGPAPAGMRVFPDAKTWRRVPSWDWHRAGVEDIRAQTIFHAASVADSLERLLTLSGKEAGQKLRSIPGIGPWTSAETLQRAAGDPDAVSVGDYNLPKAVGWALAGRQATDDATMLELLQPYVGHRYRVTRLIELSGLMPPRRGPRMSVRHYRGL
jgi:3-methyladenine DNA glycosylase/8-oxoguanine DNA glycosylase